MMIEPLETRRMLTTDLSLAGLSSTLPTSVESSGLSKVHATAKVTLVNSGTDALPKTVPAVGVSFYLKTGATETLVGTVKPVKFPNLKASGTKPLTTKLTIPASLALGTYTLIAKVDTANALAESNESNNTVTGANTIVAASGTALFAAYGFADSMTFHKTHGNVDGANFDESGTFTDANGLAGGYIYTVSAPVILGKSQVSLTLSRNGGSFNQVYIMTYLGKGPKTSIDGHTAHFSGKPNGGIKVTGGNTASGNSIYYKLT
jgi:hypothetical protein